MFWANIPDVKGSADLITILLGNSGSGLIILILILYRLGIIKSPPLPNGNNNMPNGNNNNNKPRDAKVEDIGEHTAIIGLQGQINELRIEMGNKFDSVFSAMDRKNTDLMNQINGLGTSLAIYSKEIGTIGDICKNLETLNKEWYREHCENHPRIK